MRFGFGLIVSIFQAITTGLKALNGTDTSGKPLYKNRSALASSGSVVLEGIGTALGYPGVGSAVGIILSTILGHHENSDVKPQEKGTN